MEHLAPPEPLDEEAVSLAAEFPGWKIWRSNDVYYATGACKCGSPTTLHAPDIARLRDQLKAGGAC